MRGCLCFSLFHRRHSQSCSYHHSHCTIHMSVAWRHATYPYHVNGNDTVGRSVSRSVGRSVGRSVSRSVGRSVGRSVDRSVGWSVGRSVGRSVGWSVGRSVNARGPIDHASVGLTQARPNHQSTPSSFKELAQTLISKPTCISSQAIIHFRTG